LFFDGGARMKKIIIPVTAALIVTSTFSLSQPTRRDTAVFKVLKNEFWDSIKTSLNRFYAKETAPKETLTVDFGVFNPPQSIGEFTQYWHNPPISQGNSGMCWCFSTTSFLESEIYRLTKRTIKLSELTTVYWEYVEKARGFVRARGNQEFGEGSESNAVLRAWKNHGIVPEEAYTGLPDGQPFHDHSRMFGEMNAYLKSVKASNAWNEDEVENTVKGIMNHYIGAPPLEVVVDGKKMTPKQYFEKVVRLNLDDYVSIVSFMDRPYYSWTEYNVPDNWWHSKEYFNVPLDAFMKGLKDAIRNGYTIELWGDVSEPGIYGHAGVAVVPTYDIPPQYIDASARIFRFYNGTTADDHGIHIVGYAAKDGKDWYLIKDSGSGSRNNSHPGYYFYSEDYVKLKMLGYMVPKSAVPEIVSKMK
jgi:bleomycin hydrolase